MSLVSWYKMFLPLNMRREIKELYISTIVLNFGVAMILIFEPIYLFTLGFTLLQIIGFFLVVYLVYFFIMPFGAQYAKRFGYQHSIMASTFVFILYYVVFYNIASYHWFVYPAAILYALQKTFYWPAYHADFARFVNRAEDGREIGGIDSLVFVSNILAPLLAAFIIQFFGFEALFTIVAIIFLMSNIPFMFTKEVFVPESFPYIQAYKNLLLSENRRLFFSYLGYGEELVVLVVWPVFMFVVIGSILDIGWIVASATLVTVLATMFIAAISDKRGKQGVLRFGSLFYAIVWFFRMIVQTAWGVFFIEVLSRFAKEAISVPLVSMTYERAQRRHVMRTVVFFEMSLVVGKILALVLCILIIALVPGGIVYPAMFALAALMSLLYMLA